VPDGISAHGRPSTESGGSHGKDHRTRVFGPWLRWSPLISLIAVLAYAAADHFKSSTFWAVLSTGFIAAAAALIVGGLVGFLFALPRTLEQPGSKALLATNTNLDQISDWLTKILVGLGLVQLGKVANGVDSLATALTPGLGGSADVHPFAVGLLVYSAVDGLLVGYLWTRIVVSIRLKEAAEELAARGAIREEVLSAPPPEAPPSLPPSPSAVGATSEAPAATVGRGPSRSASQNVGRASENPGEAALVDDQPPRDSGRHSS
jgi:hypothetical protein